MRYYAVCQFNLLTEQWEALRQVDRDFFVWRDSALTIARRRNRGRKGPLMWRVVPVPYTD